MIGEVRRIARVGKGSRRNRRFVSALHVALWPMLLVPRLFWPPRRRRRELRELRELREFSKILLIRVDGIGDLAMSAAVFPSLRRRFPGARIDLLTSGDARPIADL